MGGSWRQFASKFVDHSFDSYIKNFDKTDITVIQQKKRIKEKLNLDNLFPYKHSEEEIQKRQQQFEFLKQKVEKQRERIHDFDKIQQKTAQEMISQSRQKALEVRQERLANQLRVRSMVNNCPPPKQRIFTAEANNRNVFSLTNSYRGGQRAISQEHEARKARFSVSPRRNQAIQQFNLKDKQERIISRLNETEDFKSELRKGLNKIHEEATMSYDKQKQSRGSRR